MQYRKPVRRPTNNLKQHNICGKGGPSIFSTNESGTDFGGGGGGEKKYIQNTKK